MNFMSWFTVISTLICMVWLVGLGIFVLVKKILMNRAARKDIEKVEKDISDYADHK